MDAVEPDVVVSRDGVLVVRHENEIGSTTDVARHPEFAARRTVKIVDGHRVEGWFAEDFTWDELATLRARERLPRLRPDSAAFDGTEPILRLRDVLDLVRAAGTATAPRLAVAVVVEIKHATYFAGLGWDMAGLLARELAAAGWADATVPLWIESFESGVLDVVRGLGVPATYVYLAEASGTPADLAASDGTRAPTYAQQLTPSGLDDLAGRFDGISVDKRLLLPGLRGRRPTGRALVDAAHARGLRVLTWTCRPENTFLARAFRTGGGDAAFGAYEREWMLLRDTGVDGVFVDHADLGVDVFRR